MLGECLLGWEQIPAMFTAVFSLKVPTIHVLEHNILSAIWIAADTAVPSLWTMLTNLTFHHRVYFKSCLSLIPHHRTLNIFQVNQAIILHYTKKLLIYDVHWYAVTRRFECWQPSSRIHTCTCKGNVWRRSVWKSLLFLDWNSHRDNRARPSTPGPGHGTSSSHLYQQLPRIYFAKCLKNI